MEAIDRRMVDDENVLVTYAGVDEHGAPMVVQVIEPLAHTLRRAVAAFN